MNQSQRDYLVSTIRSEKDKQIRQLKDKIGDRPTINVYLTKALLRGTLKLKSEESILDFFEKRISKEGTITERGWRDGENIKDLPATVLFEEPEEYKKAVNEWKALKFEVDVAMNEIESNYKQLELRLKVASNKVLESVTAQVDDMGDIDLLNMKLAGEMSQKLLK